LTVVLQRQWFADELIRWQAQFGRNTLPWQGTRDPYRVWLSEIMLQQTQVSTVLGYFDRFLAACPNVESLASAPLDDVLGLWSGLGYYTRARNLHRCAQQVMSNHGGVFPGSAAILETLPGIGRSTAAAIASICFGERIAILDANVKRVVTRIFGFDADLAVGANERALWSAATELLPTGEGVAEIMPRYTQGVMDLGATVCSPKKPMCTVCPVHHMCKAFSDGDPHRYPVRTRKLKRSSQSLWMLWAVASHGAVLLAQRPSPGVWAGLYCFPIFESETALRNAVPVEQHQNLHFSPAALHVLTHKDLYLHVAQIELSAVDLEGGMGQWVEPHRWQALGLPAPVRKLLEKPIGV
jgi:A/G-specific adenine glycosylase